MRFLFVLIFLVASFLVARSQHTDSLFIASAVTKLKHSKEYTLQVAALMPAHQYGFRPTKDEMSFGEQVLHSCSNLSSFAGESGQPTHRKRTNECTTASPFQETRLRKELDEHHPIY